MGVNLAATLPGLLRLRGLTQEELAEMTGIRRTDINALANGRIEAGESRLSRLAAALDVSPVELDPARAEGSADPTYRTLPARLDELAETLGDALEQIEKDRRQIARLQSRVRTLEAGRVAGAGGTRGPL